MDGWEMRRWAMWITGGARADARDLSAYLPRVSALVQCTARDPLEGDGAVSLSAPDRER